MYPNQKSRIVFRLRRGTAKLPRFVVSSESVPRQPTTPAPWFPSDFNVTRAFDTKEWKALEQYYRARSDSEVPAVERVLVCDTVAGVCANVPRRELRRLLIAHHPDKNRDQSRADWHQAARIALCNKLLSAYKLGAR